MQMLSPQNLIAHMKVKDIGVLALMTDIYISASLHLHITFFFAASFTHLILLDTT